MCCNRVVLVSDCLVVGGGRGVINRIVWVICLSFRILVCDIVGCFVYISRLLNIDFEMWS